MHEKMRARPERVGGPATSRATAQGPKVDPDDLRLLAKIGAKLIVVDQVTEYADWSDRLNTRVGDLVADIGKHADVAPEKVLRQVHGIAAAVAKRFGVTAESPNAPALENASIQGRLAKLSEAEQHAQRQIETCPLAKKVLAQWRVCRPKMCRELEREHRLCQAVWAASTRTLELYLDLVSGPLKLPYDQARELACRNWYLLPDEQEQPDLNFDPSSLPPLTNIAD